MDTVPDVAGESHVLQMRRVDTKQDCPVVKLFLSVSRAKNALFALTCPENVVFGALLSDLIHIISDADVTGFPAEKQSAAELSLF